MLRVEAAGEALVPHGLGEGVPGADLLGELLEEPDLVGDAEAKRSGLWSTRRFCLGSCDGRGEKTSAEAINERRTARLAGPVSVV